MQRVVNVREKFYSNMIGQHVEAGTWLADERLKLLGRGLASSSSDSGESQARALVVLAGQIKQQAYTLAYSDSFLVIAWVMRWHDDSHRLHESDENRF